MTFENDIYRRAEQQHGALSRDEGYLLGANADWYRRRIRAGRLRAPSRHVIVVAGAPESIWLDAMVAVLDAGPGAVLSHLSALALWEVPGFRISPAHVLRPREGTQGSTTIATVHSSKRIPAEHVTVLRGVPVTSPARSCFDAAALLSPLRLSRVVDRLWSRNLLTGTQLHDMRRHLSKQGRPGLSVMDEVLEPRGRDYVPPGSGLESRLFWLLDHHGEPPLARQVVMVHPEKGFLGVSDGVDELAKVVVEVDGNAFHKAIVDREIDRYRRDHYRAMGYEVVEIGDWELWHDGRGAVERIAEARRRGRARHAG